MSAPPAAVRVVVADDHQVVRTEFAALLDTQPDFTVIGTACDGADAVRICRELDRPHGRPDAGHAPDRLPNSLLAVRELEVGVLIRVLTLCTSSQGNRSNIATITHHSKITDSPCLHRLPRQLSHRSQLTATSGFTPLFV